MDPTTDSTDTPRAPRAPREQPCRMEWFSALHIYQNDVLNALANLAYAFAEVNRDHLDANTERAALQRWRELLVNVVNMVDAELEGDDELWQRFLDFALKRRAEKRPIADEDLIRTGALDWLEDDDRGKPEQPEQLASGSTPPVGNGTAKVNGTATDAERTGQLAELTHSVWARAMTVTRTLDAAEMEHELHPDDLRATGAVMRELVLDLEKLDDQLGEPQGGQG